MSEEANTATQGQPETTQVNAAPAGQQTPPATGSDPVATTGNQTTAEAQPSGATDWKAQYDQMLARFQGLSRQFTSVSAERDAAREEIQQATSLAGTLQTQLEETQGMVQTALQREQAAAQVAAQAQQEAAYLNMVQTEYPDLAHIAGALQRMPTPDAQRAMLDQVRQQMGTQVAAATRQAVAQNLAGATPGAGPAAGGAPTGQPSREEVMAHVMDADLRRNDYAEYQRWWRIYEQHPAMNHSSLGREWTDPFGNDYQAMQAQAGQTPASLAQRHTTQAFEEAGPGMPSVGMPGAWGGSTPPRPGGDPFAG